MNIAGRHGHTDACPGANYYIDEVTEAKKICVPVLNLLKLEGGHTVYEITPNEDSIYPEELMYGINLFNSLNYDLGFSIHFNAASVTNEARGCEIILHPNDRQETIDRANKILVNFEKLGFKNRGIKFNNPSDPSDRLGELWNTNKPFMIIEVCFVDSKKDTDIYNSLPLELINRAIANGIDSNVALDIPKKIKPIFMDINEPFGQEISETTATVRGWFVSDAPRAVNVYDNGNFLGQATLGLKRPDVASIYPTYSNANSCGFSYNLVGLTPGTHTIKCEAVDYNGQIKILERVLKVNTSKECIECIKKEQVIKSLEDKINNAKKELN